MKIVERIFFCLLIYVAGLLVTSCNSNKSTHHATSISGRYINETFLQQIPDSVAGGIQGYCYEMNFINADSVMINYGFEQGTLEYEKRGDRNYALLAAAHNYDLTFTLNEDSTITLHDSTWVMLDSSWVGAPLNSTFKKVSDISEVTWVFEQYLNEKFIAGDYSLYKEGQLTSEEVVFSADGEVSGLAGYNTYSICFSGDCVQETETPHNIISFSSDSNMQDSYVFKVNPKNGSISFYALGDQLKGADGEPMKGGRSVEKLVFELKERNY